METPHFTTSTRTCMVVLQLHLLPQVVQEDMDRLSQRRADPGVCPLLPLLIHRRHSLATRDVRIPCQVLVVA